MSIVEHEHHETESHHLPPRVVADQQRKAVKLFILGDAIVFGCFIFAWFYIKAQNVNDGWLPKGAKTVPPALGLIIAGLTLVSALVYWAAHNAVRTGDTKKYSSLALGATLLALAALVVSIIQMSTWPILMSDGTYASMYVVMAGTQALHLVVLLFLALAVWNRTRLGKLADGNFVHATVVGYFWYWVALTAVVGVVITTWMH